MKKNTSVYLVAFLLFACALGYLCYAGFTENSVYFLNVSEARAASGSQLRQVRLFGVVSDKSLEKGINTLSFRLQDKDDESLVIPVIYKGQIPDTFKPGAEVIVEGGMKGSEYFDAKTLMTKCPSKYQKENRKI